MKSKEEFAKELRSVLIDRISQDHPVILELFSTGNKNLLREMVLQGYQLTRHFAIYVGGIYYRCPIAKHRKRFAFNLFEEETGRISKTNGHLELLNRFTSAIGLSEEDLDSVDVNPETKELIDYRYRLIEDKSLYHKAVSAIMVASEGQNLEERVGESRRELVSKGFGLDIDDLIFFKVHAEEDVYHVQDGINCTVDVCDTELKQRQAIEAIHETCDRFTAHYDGIYREYKKKYEQVPA
jgi:pyrroloquinoline-quinone synthase